MKDKIRHAGVVCAVSDGKVSVRILQSSACEMCKAASYCHASESKEKVVDVATSLASSYQVGDSVVVSMEPGQGYRAGFYAYLLPLVLVVLTLFVSLAAVGSEGLAACLSLAVLLPYYAILYLCRKRMGRHFQFTLE